jgi:hypothetical protein
MDDNLRFTLGADISSQSHGDGSGCKLGQSTQNNNLCVSQSRKTRAQGEGYCEPI